jgi:8-oxo-dGTP pyrophosphatase MutT (NUDIX family)
MKLQEKIRSRLGILDRRELSSGFTREAAVLIPVFEADGEPHFLLTRRTEEVETHKGQISFPGGMRENGEELQQTAIRETFEEVGIESNQIELLGRFHDYLSINTYRVVTYAGMLRQPFAAIPHPAEVAEVLLVPFRIFQDPALMRTQKMYRLGRFMNVYYYSYGSYTIWGLTARIIKDFLEELDRPKSGASHTSA